MISDVRIKNFRGFRSLELEDLAPFVLVVGPNASGKTALLEAVFLASGGAPDIPFRFRAWRGIGERIEVGTTPGGFEGLWSDLFFNQEITSLSIAIDDTVRGRRVLTIGYPAEGAVQLPLGEHPTTDFPTIPPLVFEWNADGRTHRTEAGLTPDGTLVLKPVISVLPALFLPSTPRPATENAKRYSDLSKANRESGVLEALQKLFPFVKGLSIEISAGEAAIHAFVEGLDRKLPLPLVSAGINKYLTILLAIRSSARGVVLVDEVENGFYYAAMEPLITSIVDEANGSGSQLFMTIHSWECLKAFVPAIERNPDRFALIRTHRAPEGPCGAKQFRGRSLASALEEGFEIR